LENGIILGYDTASLDNLYPETSEADCSVTWHHVREEVRPISFLYFSFASVYYVGCPIFTKPVVSNQWVVLLLHVRDIWVTILTRRLDTGVSCFSSVIILLLFLTYALQPSRPIVRSGLDVPTFATTREHPAAEGGTVGEKCLRIPRYI